MRERCKPPIITLDEYEYSRGRCLESHEKEHFSISITSSLHHKSLNCMISLICPNWEVVLYCVITDQRSQGAKCDQIQRSGNYRIASWYCCLYYSLERGCKGKRNQRDHITLSVKSNYLSNLNTQTAQNNSIVVWIQ